MPLTSSFVAKSSLSVQGEKGEKGEFGAQGTQGRPGKDVSEGHLHIIY